MGPYRPWIECVSAKPPGSPCTYFCCDNPNRVAVWTWTYGMCHTLSIFQSAKDWSRRRRSSMGLQEFPIPSCREVFGLFLGSSPGLWAATAASYCPSRIGELPKNNPENLSAWWDGKLCSAPLPLREYFRISPFLPMDVMIIDDRCKKSLATDRVGVRYQCGGGRNSPRNIPVATAKAKRHGVPWELVIFHKKN